MQHKTEPTLAVEELRQLGCQAFQGLGLTQEAAEHVCEVLVLADLFGLTTHGLSRVESYGERLQSGGISASAEPAVETLAPAIARVEGHNAVGPLVGMTALEVGMKIARQFGIGLVLARGSNHFGPISPYSYIAAEQGFASIIGSNATTTIAPSGGSDALAVLLSGSRKALCILLVGAGAMFMTFQSTAYLRYVFPSFALFSVILALPFSHDKTFPRSLAIGAGVLLILTNTRFIQAATYYGEIKPSALLSQAGRERYLQERLPIRKMVDTVNALNTSYQPVAVFAAPLMAGLRSDALYASWYNLKWKGELETATSPSELARRLRQRQVNWLIIDLKSVPQARLDLLRNVSTSYARPGDLDLRKLNVSHVEHLLNPALSSLEGWNLTSPSSYDPSRKILTVDVNTPATQRVEVTPGLTYINGVSARCATTATTGRIQANWMDAKGDFIAASIETFECTEQWETHEMNVVAPANATSVIIYASGHTDTPLEFKSLSFRQ